VQHTFITGSTNAAGRWICQQQSITAVVFFMNNAYLKELKETGILLFILIMDIMIGFT
jgi:hypothetical protein